MAVCDPAWLESLHRRDTFFTEPPLTARRGVSTVVYTEGVFSGSRRGGHDRSGYDRRLRPGRRQGSDPARAGGRLSHARGGRRLHRGDRRRRRAGRRAPPAARRASDRSPRPARGRGRPRLVRARGVDGRAPALPEGHRARAPPDGGAGGRAREADRARRRLRQAQDGRVEPPPRRLDRQELPEPGAAVPRPDPGGDARPGAGRREVRPSPRLQVLDVRHLVDPPGGRPGARRQGAHDPHARPRRREAEQDRAQPSGSSSPSSAASPPPTEIARELELPLRGGRAAAPERAGAGLAREAGRRRGGLGVRRTSSRTSPPRPRTRPPRPSCARRRSSASSRCSRSASGGSSSFATD